MMHKENFNRTVFINCPLDDEYAPLLHAVLFCIVYLGFTPQIASQRLETGENRFDKIVSMIRSSKYSVHDLSRCKAARKGEHFRMNMPFELGMDFGFRKSGNAKFRSKKFLILEKKQYDLKKSLSDIAGTDVEFHNSNYKILIEKIRNFLWVEAGVKAPGAVQLIEDYATFQGWMTDKKVSEGHSEETVLNLPTEERLDEMRVWMKRGKPSGFTAPR